MSAEVDITNMATLATFDPTSAVADVLDRYASLILVQIKANWPVKTGYSQAQWTTALETFPGGVLLRITNGADYAGYVRVKGSGEIVLDEITLPLVDDLMPELVDAIMDAIVSMWGKA